jgi:hypothetical protein
LYIKEKLMHVQRWAWAALLAFLAVAGSSRAADPKPAAPGVVVRIKSLDGLLDDAAYLAKTVGKEEEAKQFQQMILAQAGEKGLKGLDRTRPLGAYGSIGQAVTDSTVVVLIPVKDEDAVLALLDNLNLKVEKGDGGIYTLNLDFTQVPIYFRFANGYAYVTALNRSALQDKAKLPAPGDLLPADNQALVSFTAYLNRIPENLRQRFVSEVQGKAKEAKEERKEKETDAQHALKEEAITEIVNIATQVVREGRALQAQVVVDRKANQLVLEAGLDARPGSPLAGMLEHLGAQKSLFAGLAGKDAALDLAFHIAAPEHALKPFADVLDEGIKSSLAKETDARKREQGEKLIKALLPSLKAGELDAGFVIRGPASDHTYTLVGGIKIKDGEDLEKTVRQLIDGLPEKDRNKVHFDAAKTGEVAIHRLDVADSIDEQGKKLLGPQAELYVAFRRDALLVAAGHDALSAIKEAVVHQPAPGRPFGVDLHLARFAPFMEKDNPGATKIAEEVFKKEGTDRVRIDVEGGKEVRLRVRITPEALAFYSKVDEAKKAAQEKQDK